MKRKPTLRNKFLLVAFIFSTTISLSAQILIEAPAPADNPNLAGNSPWSAICAGVGGFNQYYAKIAWAGNANTANEFILELSNSNGDFTNAAELVKSVTKTTIVQKNLILNLQSRQSQGDKVIK